MKLLNVITVACVLIQFSGCAGMKVVKENKNAGTLMVNSKGQLVETYTCEIVATNGKKVSAIGDTKTKAKEEALARCRDQTLISVCLEKNVKCVNN